MKPGEAEYWGQLAEAAVRTQFDLERDRSSWHDARTETGTPVESKTCRVVLANGRRGRWWIEREAHERLLEESGLYALSTYDPQNYESGPISVGSLVSAESIDGALTWTSNGRDHHKGEEHAKLAWPRVFVRTEGVA